MTRSVESLVEQQAARWRVARRAAEQAGAAPCVTVSRLPRSHGASIGTRLAERLGFGFFGIEILDTIAREHGIARRLLEDLDEHVRSAIERQISDAMGHRTMTESEYLRHVVRVVTTLGTRGGCVILGRGASFIVPPERALRILITAPEEARAERLAGERGIPLAEARAELAREDAERMRFVQHHFGRDPNDPIAYDLALNTGSLSVDACVSIALAAFAERFPSHRIARV